MLSRKFRQAFKRTLCRCCLNINSLPTFYKLKAKFINNDPPGASTASGNRYLCPEKNSMRLATFYSADRPKSSTYANDIIEPASTRDTMVNRTSRTSTCSSHAHSDGGLHYLCRHKRCLNRRQSSLSPRQNCNTVSYQDIKLLRQNDSIRSHESIHKRRENSARRCRHLTDSSHRVIIGKPVSPRFHECFDWILFILADNNDMHESLDEFEIWPDSTTDYGVSCP